MSIDFTPTDAHLVTPGFGVQDIKNGALATIVAMVPRSAIPPEYKWPVVVGMPKDMLIPRLDALAQITAARMVLAGMPRAAARPQAIVLAAIRCAATIHYDIQVADLSAGERVDSIFTYRPAVTAVPGANPPVVGVQEGIDVNWPVAHAVAGNAELAAWTHFTPEERTVATDHLLLGMPVPVTQGWSIVKCGHHFLSPEAAGMRSGWNAIKRQLIGKISKATQTWISANSDWWEDVCFHKATHPIDMALKVGFAQSEELKAKIKAADWGSATVRLPATEPDFEFAKVTIALASKVRQIVIEMGGTVDTRVLEERTKAVFDATTPTMRADAISAAVTYARHRVTYIAYMAGMLDAITTAAGSGRSSILQAKGLARVVADEPASFAKGQAAYRGHAIHIAAEAARGIIASPHIVL